MSTGETIDLVGICIAIVGFVITCMPRQFDRIRNVDGAAIGQENFLFFFGLAAIIVGLGAAIIF